MATLKTILDTRSEKKDGTYPVKVSVFHKGSTFYLSTDISVKKGNWENGEVTELPKAKNYNRLIRQRYDQAESNIDRLFDSGRLSKLTPKELKYFLENGSEPEENQADKYTLENHFNRYISNCRAKGTADIYRVTLCKLNDFGPGITFDQVNLSWLKSFDTHLSKTCATNTRAIHMRNIRAVFNDAINEDKVSLDLYPFRKFKIRKEKQFKGALTVDQLKLFRDCQAEEHQKRYQELAMLSFYLIGINCVDLVHLKHSDYTNGRINYIRAKTGRKYSIEVLPEAMQIIEKYKGENYLINVMDHYANYKDFKAKWNANLKQIGKLEWVSNNAKKPENVKKNKKLYTGLFKDLTVYHFRRTWGTIADSLDIPIDTIAMCLGHGGETVTHSYVDKNLRKIDKANRDVLKALVS